MKQYYKRGYLLFAEQLLRDYPERREELRELEAFLEARGGGGVHVLSGGGTDTPEPERLVEAKEQNRRYQWLSQWVERMEAALSSLTEDDRRLVRLILWENVPKWAAADDLHVAHSTLWRCVNRVLAKIVSVALREWA
jgi:predicted DNA-binding protein (UPF0251 family)